MTTVKYEVVSSEYALISRFDNYSDAVYHYAQLREDGDKHVQLRKVTYEVLLDNNLTNVDQLL